MTGTLRSHGPGCLLLKDDPVYPRFQPGNTVSHVDDPQSWGMVLSRREVGTGPVIDVLWSRAPEPKSPDHVPRQELPVPMEASWSVTVESPSDLSRGVSWRRSFDGEERYGPGQLTPADLDWVCRAPHSVEFWAHDDGSVSVQHRGASVEWVPSYVNRAPPTYRTRYDHGRPVGP